MMNTIKVSALMTSDIITSNSKETLSKVISKMSFKSLHELPVVDDENKVIGYFGFELLSKKKHVPVFTKIEKLMVAPPKVDGDDTVYTAAKTLLETGFRAVPVVDRKDHLIGLVSRTDIIYAASNLEGVSSESAESIMTPDPRVLNLNDHVETALSLMVELDELCAPVVDKNNRVVGGVLIDDISKGIWRFEDGVDVGDLAGENDKPMIEVKSFVTPVATAVKNDSLRSFCEKMSSLNPYLCVVVDESKKPLGVITQYDILKRFVRYESERGVYVDITGLDVRDPFVYSSMVSKIERFVKKIGRFRWMNPINLSLHVEKSEKGGRARWGIRARLKTDNGLFYVKADGWDLLVCVDEIVKELSKKILAVKPKELRR